MQKPYLEAGKIVNTHGVRGEVRIQPWADDAAFLLGFRTFYIDGAPVHVAHSRVHKGMLVVKFQGVDDVNAAMTLKNRVVSIARADVTLPAGQYFQQDLLGITVETDAGETLGTLREILDLPRGSVYTHGAYGTHALYLPRENLVGIFLKNSYVDMSLTSHATVEFENALLGRSGA